MKKTSLLWVARLSALTALLAADQLVKCLVSGAIPFGTTRPFLPLIQLTHVVNDGAAWSLFRGGRWFFVAATVAVVAAMAAILIRGVAGHWIGRWGMIAVMAGALGNGIDRALHGGVVDMFEFTFVSFPVFNMADVYITFGAIALGVYLLFFHDKKKTEETQSTDQNQSAQPAAPVDETVETPADD